MFQQFLDLVRSVIFLMQKTDQNTQDINALQHGLEELTKKVDELALELRHQRETERHEREKLMLQLENVLLRFERRFPPPQ